MSVDTSAVHESIKLALDAADAATDVTSEYNKVNRIHQKLEAKVKMIHRYTTIIFVSSIIAGERYFTWRPTCTRKSCWSIYSSIAVNRRIKKST